MSILFVMLVSAVVSGFFFVNSGTEAASMQHTQLLGLFFGIIPTNIVLPFVENNTPQLVILGFLFGSALLMLGDRVKQLNALLLQINEWMMSVMRLVLMIMPVIPFFSLFTIIGSGNGKQLLEGWKFIVECISYSLSASLQKRSKHQFPRGSA